MAHPTTRGLPFLATSGSNAILSKRSVLKLSAALWLCLPASGIAQAVLPQGGSVASGQATITRPNGTSVVINQGSNNAIVNWNSFSIGQGGHVDIRQPGTNSAILNRVTGDTTSEIHGRLTANGTVHLVNPNGIFIGPNGTVNAGSFSASTLDISNEDFNAGRLRYGGNGNSATVENAGRITIGRGGYAALIGGKVRNSGTVTVPYGRIGFAAGEKVVLDVSGDQFLQVAVPSSSEDDGEALITNSGTASAEGGLIEMRAATARHAARHAINLSGVAEASSVSVRGGTIVLGGGAGGRVTVSGRASTRAKPAGIIVSESKRPPVRGGSITITGRDIALSGADIDASADNGGGLIRIGGDFAGAGDLQRADTLISDANTNIRSDALSNGDGGRIVLWSDVETTFPGTISSRGGNQGGDGGFVEVSSKKNLSFSGFVDRRAPLGAAGMLLLDPEDIIVGSSLDPRTTLLEATLETNLLGGPVTLDTFNSSLSEAGDIEINADIDWTSGNSLTLNAENQIRLNGSLNGGSADITFSANGAGTNIFAADGVSITANRFRINDGEWREVDSSLTQLNVTDFGLDFDVTFLRALSGSGAAGDAFMLTDVFGLQGIGASALSTSSFQLANDIDASATANWNLVFMTAQGFEAIDNFGGTLDGDGHTISNLTITADTGEGFSNSGGLFQALDSTAEVTDLTLSDLNLSARNAGGLALTNAGTIRNVVVDGDIGTVDGVVIGGLVATNTGLIEDSATDVDISGTLNSFVSDELVVGGFVGTNQGTINRSHAVGDIDVSNTNMATNANVGGFAGIEEALGMTINDSYAQGDVSIDQNAGGSGLAYIGGFVGSVRGAINRSFSSGTVGGTSANFGDLIAGGFAGEDSGGSGSTSNFWDINTSGISTSAFGTGLTTAQFQDTETFIALASAQGWNFDTTWAPGDTGFYPVNYSTSAVLFATPDPLTVQYGQTDGADATGTIIGGAPLFQLGVPGETISSADVFQNVLFDGINVGSQTFRLSQSNVTGSAGTNFRIVDRVGTGTITPAPLTIRANDQIKLEGTTLVFNGTEFSVAGLQFSDSVSSVDLFSEGAAADAAFANSPFDIFASNALGTGLSNYDITFQTGVLSITQETTEVPIPPIFIGFPLPNPTDEIDDGSGDSDGATISGGGTVQQAENTLAAVEGLAAELEIAADACGESSGDVTRYLACLADALSDFSDELDAISADLPPGMQNVARIVQDARVQIDQSRARAQQRLASATTDAERQAIRQDAANEARAALATASSEIRKSISLVRADDPELASVQRATVTTVANAVDNVGISLTRAVGL